MPDRQPHQPPIYHMCRRQEWADAQARGAYPGSSQDRATYPGSSRDRDDGFMHFSTAGQIVGSAAKHRAGQAGLVLLAVDPGKLGEALQWEESRGGALFPHLYGELPLAAVVAVHDLPLGADGRHVFPVLA